MTTSTENTAVWRLGRRTAHYVLHPTGTCYRVRVLWSSKLGLELDYDLYDERDARRTCERIAARGSIEIARWRRIYYPSRTPSWLRAPMQRELPLTIR